MFSHAASCTTTRPSGRRLDVDSSSSSAAGFAVVSAVHTGPNKLKNLGKDEGGKKTRDNTDAALDKGRAASVLMPAKPVAAV